MERTRYLRLLKQDLEPNILLCSNPDCAGKSIQFLHPVVFNMVYKGFVTVSGYLNDLPVTVIGTGLGKDVVEIVLTEINSLLSGDNDVCVIRLGEAESLVEQVKFGDFVIVFSASEFAEEACCYQECRRFMSPAVSDYELGLALLESCNESHVAHHFGEIISVPNHLMIMDNDNNQAIIQKFVDNGISVLDIDSSYFLKVARFFKMKASSICMVNKVLKRTMDIQEDEKSSNQLLKVSLKALDIYRKMQGFKREKGIKNWLPSMSI